jgi:hypothetical protein
LFLFFLLATSFLESKGSFRLAARYFSGRDKAVKKVITLVGPIVEERRLKMQQFGEEWADKPVCLQLFIHSS